jgi:hypothetical protein
MVWLPGHCWNRMLISYGYVQQTSYSLIWFTMRVSTSTPDGAADRMDEGMDD